jgi:hypothetical protein
MVQTPTKPDYKPLKPFAKPFDRPTRPKPKPFPSCFVRKVVTLIRESGYDYKLDELTHEKKEVVIRCHPMASLREIENIIYSKAINADWDIEAIAYKELSNER